MGRETEDTLQTRQDKTQRRPRVLLGNAGRQRPRLFFKGSSSKQGCAGGFTLGRAR